MLKWNKTELNFTPVKSLTAGNQWGSFSSTTSAFNKSFNEMYEMYVSCTSKWAFLSILFSKRCCGSSSQETMNWQTCFHTVEDISRFPSSISGIFYTVHLSKEFCNCQLRCHAHAVDCTVCKRTHLVHL